MSRRARRVLQHPAGLAFARRRLLLTGIALALGAVGCGRAAATASEVAPAAAPAASSSWWKGNTHTHSFWSDGGEFPEVIADWYKENGYHFLSMTDHNPQPREKWVGVPASGVLRTAYDGYRARFGADWVEERRSGDTLRVRLRRLDEYRSRLEAPGRFLLIPGEEITQYLARKAAHMNGVNLAEEIPPQEGESLVEILRRDLAAIAAQRERTKQPMIGVLNHPNFLWSQTAEDLLVLPALRFFEVYNGHPLVHTAGDSLHAGTERMWDIVLTWRAARGEPLLYGVATDDAHDYHKVAPTERNPGRGWVMVRAPELSADAIVRAMEGGDFYATTGVELTDLRREGNRISLSIRAEPGVRYTAQMVGTRAGFDTTSAAVHDSTGAALTRRYSRDVGAVLAEVSGAAPSFTLRGDELYARIRITSSRPKANPSYAGEVEMAWTQPVRP